MSNNMFCNPTTIKLWFLWFCFFTINITFNTLIKNIKCNKIFNWNECFNWWIFICPTTSFNNFIFHFNIKIWCFAFKFADGLSSSFVNENFLSKLSLRTVFHSGRIRCSSSQTLLLESCAKVAASTNRYNFQNSEKKMWFNFFLQWTVI